MSQETLPPEDRDDAVSGASAGSSAEEAHPTDGLWSRLRLIEGQPLASRAAAYSALHDDLARRLEQAPRAEGGSPLEGTGRTPSPAAR